MDRSRRAFLERMGAVAIGVGLAGCSGQSNGEGTTGTVPATESLQTTTAAQTTEGADASPNGTETTGTAESTGTSASVQGTVVTAESTNGLNITEHNFFRSGDVAGVEGVLKNTSNKTFEYAEVKVSPVNETGDRAGQFYTSTQAQNVNTLKPGETWNFVVSFSSEWVQDFNKYEIWATGTTQMQGTETGGNGTATGTQTQTQG
ncbi:FxLYD domain-containing protein [Halopelagius fulvigenes]|uniref:FxLYD domain-containing protein n=1 Tax=Halopelagius fulvigenes TaxID=1198324 RepID=A0ABD5U2V6_9EURY